MGQPRNQCLTRQKKTKAEEQLPRQTSTIDIDKANTGDETQLARCQPSWVELPVLDSMCLRRQTPTR